MPCPETVVRDSNNNPVVYVSLDAAAKPVVRRTVVDRDACNRCHQDLGSPAGLSIHGGSRRNPEYCVMCHNPNLTSTRVTEGLEFDHLIHSLHMGKDRAVPALFPGSRSTAAISYPGDQRNCSKCHVKDTNTLPLAAGQLPMASMQADKSILLEQATSAACTSCHAAESVVAYAETQTTAKGSEACAVCHGKGDEFGVSEVHKKP